MLPHCTAVRTAEISFLFQWLENGEREFVMNLPLEMTRRRLLRAVVQFQRRCRNWCWHSAVPSWAPLTISCRTWGSLRQISAWWWSLLLFIGRSLWSRNELLNGRPGRYWCWPALLLARLSRHSRIGSNGSWPALEKKIMMRIVIFKCDDI